MSQPSSPLSPPTSPPTPAEQATLLARRGTEKLRNADQPGARADYEAALAIDADCLPALNNMMGLLAGSGDYPAALAHGARAIALAPEDPRWLHNYGLTLSAAGQFPQAVTMLRRALAQAPDDSAIRLSLGAALVQDRQPAAALAPLEAILAQRPDHGEARYNLALAQLMLGRLSEGWVGHEARWETRMLAPSRATLPMPLWRGEDPKGLTILLHPEQGFGDSLQFMRYAPLLAARGAAVHLLLPPSLVRLARSLGPDITVGAVDAGGYPAADRHCPLMSLPLAFGTRLDSIPAGIPYLQADPGDRQHWRNWLALRPAGLRIGLVWAGGDHADLPWVVAAAKRRSLPLATLAPILDRPDCCYVSLQLGTAAAQAKAFPAIQDPTAMLRDFADTAALIAELDLVITVDTALAHLAGALGKPVWMMSRYDGCWRWLLDRDDSPWYPSLRLFRQPAPAAWDPVVADIVAALTRLHRDRSAQVAIT